MQIAAPSPPRRSGRSARYGWLWQRGRRQGRRTRRPTCRATCVATLTVSTSHRDAGRHVADLDTDGGTAVTCALTSGGTPWLTSRLGARFRAHPRGPRWTPAGRCRGLAIGTSRDVVPCKPSVGHSTWVVEGGRGRLGRAPCLPAGRDAATLTGIRWPGISRR